MKGSADIQLMQAATASVQVLREVLSQLSATDAAEALQAITKARPVIQLRIDRLRLGLKGRPPARQRPNQFAATPWSIAKKESGPKPRQARTAEIATRNNHDENTANDPNLQ